jgi:hypothetical protein
MNNLVGLSTYARRIGKCQSTLQRYQDGRADFPKPALVIDEYRRVKRLWGKSTLDSYFAKIESERLVKQELAQIRAARKRANAELYKYCRFLGGQRMQCFSESSFWLNTTMIQ